MPATRPRKQLAQLGKEQLVVGALGGARGFPAGNKGFYAYRGNSTHVLVSFGWSSQERPAAGRPGAKDTKELAVKQFRTGRVRKRAHAPPEADNLFVGNEMISDIVPGGCTCKASEAYRQGRKMLLRLPLRLKTVNPLAVRCSLSGWFIVKDNGTRTKGFCLQEFKSGPVLYFFK